jgi:hypothetical protein
VADFGTVVGTLILALGIAAAAVGGSGPKQEDAEFSCRSFRADLTHDQLIERYGADRVSVGPIQTLDDGPVEGTHVTLDGGKSRLEVGWSDPETRTSPWSVRAFGEAWETPQGIRLGMELRTVERMNGWPFRLGGLDWEPLGAVRSWGPRGRLKDESVQGCRMAIHFQTRPGENRNDVVLQVLRGREFSSGHPAYQELNPTVQILRLYFPPSS